MTTLERRFRLAKETPGADRRWVLALQWKDHGYGMAFWLNGNRADWQRHIAYDHQCITASPKGMLP